MRDAPIAIFGPAVPMPDMGSSPADYIRTIRKLDVMAAHCRITKDRLLKQACADGLNKRALKGAANLAYGPSDIAETVIVYLTEWSENR